MSCTSTISEFENEMESVHINLTFPRFSKEPSLKITEFYSARSTIEKNFLMKLWKRLFLSSEPFSTRRTKMLSRSGGFMLYGKLGVEFVSTSALLYRKIKIRLRLNRAKPLFT